MTEPMKVVVVDDHPLTRRGLDAVLRTVYPNCEIWGTSRTSEAITLTTRVRPDLILLDLQLPEPPTSAATCRALRDRGVSAPIVIVTAYEHPREIAACLAAGANGCLLKDSSTAYLIAAFRRVMEGRTVIDSRIEQSLTAYAAGRPAEPPPALTERELEILTLVSEGLSNKAISQQLTVAESTVKWHVRRVMTKLGAESRWQAVVAGREHGLL